MSPLICPSVQVLRLYGAEKLKHLIEAVDEGWNRSIPVYGPRPRPDYSVGFGRCAFSEEQLMKLEHLKGDIEDSSISYFMATWLIHSPFLTCEVKGADGAFDVPDRQNLHSMTLAVRSVVELY